MNLVIRNIFLTATFLFVSLLISHAVPQANEVKEIKAYVQAAKQLGYNDAQILSEFKKAVQMVDHNNSEVVFSLNDNDNADDDRIFWCAMSVLGVATVAAGICLFYYLLKEDPAATTPANTSAPNNTHREGRVRAHFGPPISVYPLGVMNVNNLNPEAVGVNAANLVWARSVAVNSGDILRCEELFDQLRNNVLATGVHQIQLEEQHYIPVLVPEHDVRHLHGPRMINLDEVRDVNALRIAVENLAA